MKSVETGVFCDEEDESRREGATGGGQAVLMGAWEMGDDALNEAIRQFVIGLEITQVTFTPSYGDIFRIC